MTSYSGFYDKRLPWLRVLITAMARFVRDVSECYRWLPLLSFVSGVAREYRGGPSYDGYVACSTKNVQWILPVSPDECLKTDHNLTCRQPVAKSGNCTAVGFGVVYFLCVVIY